MQRGQKQGGRWDLVRSLRPSLIPRFPHSPHHPLVTGAWLCPESCAGPRQLPPCRSLLRLPPPPMSIQLEVSVLHLCCPRGNSAGESETRWLQRSHMHTTYPPGTPSVSPKSWQGQWPLLQHLRPRLCCCDPSWSSAGTERPSNSCPGARFGQGPVLGPFLGAQPLQGDLGEREHPATPPRLRVSPSALPCAGAGGAGAGLTCGTAWACPQHGWLVSSLSCHRSSPGAIPAHPPGSFRRWISPSWLLPVSLPAAPVTVLWCDWAAGSITVGSWEPRFLNLFNLQPVLPSAPACNGISLPVYPFPPLGSKPGETQK